MVLFGLELHSLELRFPPASTSSVIGLEVFTIIPDLKVLMIESMASQPGKHHPLGIVLQLKTEEASLIT